ncbi:hypothetical protein PE067_16445 [Paracoccus sp. DMF-8]|uniref:hypothetical protein n=1 Tax=Paracoccus sp. DMF-8 TaxID=3019445 RepID=UPI0023E3A7F4|nr:hypothetical protein [Paracoccus sp. DMF-8]MDF3607595.1 hypothetical protein [Paracoccus sp. DMF-8]
MLQETLDRGIAGNKESRIFPLFLGPYVAQQLVALIKACADLLDQQIKIRIGDGKLSDHRPDLSFVTFFLSQ